MQLFKQSLKQALGRSVLSAGQMLPCARPLLRRVGIRTSQDLFGNRTISIPLDGRKHLRLTQVDESYLAFQLFWRGYQFYEPITRALLTRLLNPGDTFIDIGAHVGFFALTTA